MFPTFYGEVTERLKELAWNASAGLSRRGFESLSHRYFTLGALRSSMMVGSNWPWIREPRQVREEATVSVPTGQ